MRNVALVVAVALAGAGAALVLLGRSTSHEADRPAAPTVSAGAQDTAAPAEAAREEARQKLAQVERALANVPQPRKVKISGSERRPGESQAFYEERQRAIAEFNHFARDASLAPEQVQAVAGIIADAQDMWRNGLAAAHRTQPEAPGAEMADPVLSQLMLSINEDAQRALREHAPPAQAAIIHSYFPTMLSYVRTQAFEPAR